jgi:histidine triad (HIT) family protein
MSGCTFCDIVKGKREGTFVYRDDRVSVFMDVQPINPGHMLVVPNEHASYLSDLDPETGAQMFRVAQKMTASLRKSALRCEGVNLFLADGEAALQDVFHVHLHVIPRFKGDGFGLVLADTYHTRPPRTELERAAEKIRKTIEQEA